MDAVIDIGSNSVRLFVENGEDIAQKQLNTTQLAQNLAITGRLDENAMVRTANAVADFFARAKALGAKNVYIFGTEAMRCPGGEILKSMIQSKIPASVDIISGDTEALLGYIGATGGKGSNAVIDIGGASVELISGNGKSIDYAESLPLGVVRTKDTVGSARKDIEKFYSQKILGFKKVSADKLIGIGGTSTSLASMAMHQRIYDAHAIHGKRLTRNDIEALTDAIFASHDITAEFPTIAVKRAEVIGHGAVLLGLMMDYLDFSEITISERDNMEGYLLYLRLNGKNV